MPKLEPQPHQTIPTRALHIYSPASRNPHHQLQEMLAYCPPNTLPNEPVEQLEQRVAALLGKPAAMFCASGKTAQQIALRIHAEQTGRWTFAAHPYCHFDWWEGRNYAVLHNLRMHTIGERYQLFTAQDIQRVGEPLGAVVWELPQRELGGTLPSWEALNSQVRVARATGAKCHMDGGRILAAQTYYERPHQDIASLFDSVYFSLYKGIDGVCGAVLAGEPEFIAHARVWNRRLGGLLPQAWPIALAALKNFDTLLPRMAAFKAHAITLAAAINEKTAACTVPEIPQTTLFHIHLPIPRPQLEQAARRLRDEQGIDVFARSFPQPNPRWSAFEISVGENAMAFSADELVQIVQLLLDSQQMNT